MSGPSTAATYQANADAYRDVQPDYEILRVIIERALKRGIRELGMEAIVQARVKELASFAEKSIRKAKEYPHPVEMMNDLCGARVIAESTGDIEPICTFIRQNFEIDDATTEDAGARLDTDEFGYRSIHFTVALKKDELKEEMAAALNGKTDAEAIKVRLLAQRKSYPEEGRNRLIPQYRAEIQVRSLLQHTWANLHHDRVYKSAFKLPVALNRDMARMAALLEDADENFSRIIQAIDGYREYYGTYLPWDCLSEELKKDRQVLVIDSRNRKLALKAARMAVCLERWQEVVEVLDPFVKEWDAIQLTIEQQPVPITRKLDEAIDLLRFAATPTHRRHAVADLERLRDPVAASLLLDYGVAQWRCADETLDAADKARGKARGRDCLRRATGLNLKSADALIALADAYDEDGLFSEALGHYGRAFEVNPEEPRALRGFLQLTAEDLRNLDFIPPMRPTLYRAIERCQERAALGIYLPWAYYDMGCFRLLAGEAHKGIEAYAKAVDLSQSETPILRANTRAERLCKALTRTPATEWTMLRRFLAIARVSKLQALARAAEAEVDKREAAVPATAQALSKAQTSGASQDELDRRQAEADQALADLAAARQKAREQRSAASERWDSFVTEERVAGPKCPPLGARVVIVAGGCSPDDNDRLHQYAPWMETAFADFEGTVFCGGTHDGIAGIVGDLPAASCGPIQKLACMPENLPREHPEHPGYVSYSHPGVGFSPLGPIQVWADILGQKIDPTSVRVIGIGGGQLAGLEYRLALTMGAKVAVFPNSGRAAADVLEDPDWMVHPNLIALPEDPQTLKVFVAGLSSSGIFSETEREATAKSEHERNVQERRKALAPDDQPRNQPWAKLRNDLKDSILERVDFSVEQLRAVDLRAVRNDQVPPGVATVPELSHDQIEKMAEMEHGRWCVNKFLDGWHLGPRNDEAKTHPDLLPWDKLDEPTKDKDRGYARRVPGMLDDKGMVIVAIQPAAAAE